MSESVLEVRDLSVRLQTRKGLLRAVTDIDLTVHRGRTLCLVGESGSGKSMTAMAVMNLLPASAARDAERLSLSGQDLSKLAEREMRALRGDRVSMIFQEPMTALNPLFTIGAQITDVLRRHRDVGAREARRTAVELLAKVGLPEPERRFDQYPHQQSGGQRQRVMIAMALICQPDLLIADEPTTALDATVQLQLLRLLADLQREFGMGMLFITHDLGVVANIADDVAVMYGGRIVEFGAVSEVLHAPRHPYTRALISCLPMTGASPRTALPVIEGNASVATGVDAGCAFRDRCRHARPACTTDDANAMHALPGTGYVRCVLARKAPVAVDEGA